MQAIAEEDWVECLRRDKIMTTNVNEAMDKLNENIAHVQDVKLFVEEMEKDGLLVESATYSLDAGTIANIRLKEDAYIAIKKDGSFYVDAHKTSLIWGFLAKTPKTELTDIEIFKRDATKVLIDNIELFKERGREVVAVAVSPKFLKKLQEYKDFLSKESGKGKEEITKWSGFPLYVQPMEWRGSLKTQFILLCGAE